MSQPNNDAHTCKDFWAVPPTTIMLAHGNDYHTCNKCGEKIETVDLKAEVPNNDALLDEIITICENSGVKLSVNGTFISDMLALFAAEIKKAEVAQTKRLRNLIRQQGAGSWQRVFESELAAQASKGGTDE